MHSHNKQKISSDGDYLHNLFELLLACNSAIIREQDLISAIVWCLEEYTATVEKNNGAYYDTPCNQQTK